MQSGNLPTLEQKDSVNLLLSLPGVSQLEKGNQKEVRDTAPVKQRILI